MGGGNDFITISPFLLSVSAIFIRACTVDSPDPQRLMQRSHLFTVRLWSEPVGDGQYEWRGRVQHVLSGEWRYFREWPALERYVMEKLQELDAQEPP
jgi:hypothetical protein